MTLRLLFHPVEDQGCTQVSGSSLLGNGPSARSRSRMSRRQASFVVTQSRWYCCQSAQLTGPRPLRHLGAIQREVLGRSQRAPQLDQRLLVDRVAQLLR